jgi:tight adherence protein B
LSTLSIPTLLGLISGALFIGILSHFMVNQFFIMLSKLQLKSTQFRKLGSTKELTSAQKIMLIGVVLGLFVMVLDDFLTGLLFVTLAVLCGYGFEKGPGLIKKRQMRKRQDKLAELFPQALGMSIQALKTGQTVPQVLVYLSREASSPLKSELSQVCAEMDMGSSAEQALSKMAERFPDFSEFHQFLESYKISRQTGTNLTHLLEVLLEGMEEKSRILRKMEAMTAQARLSGLLMGILPFLLGFVFFLMDPNLMTPLFTEKAGWAILILAAILESIGFLWIRQLLQVEF